MKRILSMLACIMILILSVVNANAMSLEAFGKDNSPRFKEGVCYWVHAKVVAGTIIGSVVCNSKEVGIVDEVSTDIEIINMDTSKLVHSKHLQLNYNMALRHYISSLQWKLAKSGKYKVQATFRAYSKGKLVETVTIQSPICEYK